ARAETILRYRPRCEPAPLSRPLRGPRGAAPTHRAATLARSFRYVVAASRRVPAAMPPAARAARPRAGQRPTIDWPALRPPTLNPAAARRAVRARRPEPRGR